MSKRLIYPAAVITTVSLMSGCASGRDAVLPRYQPLPVSSETGRAQPQVIQVAQAEDPASPPVESVTLSGSEATNTAEASPLPAPDSIPVQGIVEERPPASPQVLSPAEKKAQERRESRERRLAEEEARDERRRFERRQREAEAQRQREAKSARTVRQAEFSIPPAQKLGQASVPSRASLRAIVLPVVLAGSRPTWKEDEIVSSLFSGRGFRRTLAEASNGKFMLAADVFPALVDVNTSIENVTTSPNASQTLSQLAQRIVSEWAKRGNLAAYDNDGPDGRPMSGDDDGSLDVVYIVIESETSLPVSRVKTDMDIFGGRGGNFSVKAAEVQILAIPPKNIQSDTTSNEWRTLMNAFDYLGVAPGEVYFPAPLENVISSVTRMRLGWLPVATLDKSYDYKANLAVGGLKIPFRSQGEQFWLVDRRGDTIYVSRAVQLRDGYQVIEAESHHFSEPQIILGYTDDDQPLQVVIEPQGESGEISVRFITLPKPKR